MCGFVCARGFSCLLSAPANKCPKMGANTRVQLHKLTPATTYGRVGSRILAKRLLALSEELPDFV